MADEPLPPESQNDNGPESPAETVAAHLAAENAELKDRLLRAMAEMENLRRRTDKEVSDARQYAVSSFAREVLTVGDNLRRALDAVPAEQRETAEGALSALLSGVELTERELLKILSKHGVTVLDPSGQKFDPNLHQAMFEVPDASVPSGTVVNVVQPGYVIGDRVLRPAMVGISKGGPKSARGNDAKPAAAGSDADAN